ncbi:MAG: SDR family oxidoreductase [Gammaproteobacteria bacterium]
MNMKQFSNPIYFITGTTGFLGGEILRTILAQNPNAQCYCLVRDASFGKFTFNSDNVFPIKGDIAHQELGLSTQEYQALAKKITHIIHSAAAVQLEKSSAFLEPITVQCTKNMIAFAKACQQHNSEFKVYGHVSTAYVAGKHTGIVTEDDFSDAHGFQNNYEATKFAAEKLVHEVKSSLPVIIFRPSIILGHTQDGKILPNNMLLSAIKCIKKIPLRIFLLPANGNCLLDLVPVDYVAESIYILMKTPAAIGRAFHLTCGKGNELTIKQMVRIFAQVYRKQILIVPASIWLITIPLLSCTKRGRDALATIIPLRLYTISNPQYCNQATQQLLDQQKISLNFIEDVLKKTLLFLSA